MWLFPLVRLTSNPQLSRVRRFCHQKKKSTYVKDTPRRMKLLVDSLACLFNVRSPSSLLIFSIIGYLRFHVLPDGNSLGYIKLHERCIANHYVNSNAPFLCIYSLLNEEYCVSLFNYIYKNTLGVYHAPKDFFGDIIV